MNHEEQVLIKRDSQTGFLGMISIMLSIYLNTVNRHVRFLESGEYYADAV